MDVPFLIFKSKTSRKIVVGQSVRTIFSWMDKHTKLFVKCRFFN